VVVLVLLIFEQCDKVDPLVSCLAFATLLPHRTPTQTAPSATRATQRRRSARGAAHLGAQLLAAVADGAAQDAAEHVVAAVAVEVWMEGCVGGWVDGICDGMGDTRSFCRERGENGCACKKAKHAARTAHSTKHSAHSAHLPGRAPSAMEKDSVRMWSATTRYAMSTPSTSSLPICGCSSRWVGVVLFWSIGCGSGGLQVGGWELVEVSIGTRALQDSSTFKPALQSPTLPVSPASPFSSPPAPPHLVGVVPGSSDALDFIKDGGEQIGGVVGHLALRRVGVGVGLWWGGWLVGEAVEG